MTAAATTSVDSADAGGGGPKRGSQALATTSAPDMRGSPGSGPMCTTWTFGINSVRLKSHCWIVGRRVNTDSGARIHARSGSRGQRGLMSTWWTDGTNLQDRRDGAGCESQAAVAGSTHDRVHRLCHGLHLAWSDPVLGTSLCRTLMDQPRPAARPGRHPRADQRLPGVTRPGLEPQSVVALGLPVLTYRLDQSPGRSVPVPADRILQEGANHQSRPARQPDDPDPSGPGGR